MSTQNTKIQWTDSCWNPVRGCSRVSPGCDNCYAMGQAHRFSGPGGPYDGLTTLRKGKVDWSGRVRFVPNALGEPLRWRKPRRVFVNSMSDLFHESLSNEQVAAVFGVMAACPQHTFQVLTKRAERMREWFEWLAFDCCDENGPPEPVVCGIHAANHCADVDHLGLPATWPLFNVWLGVSAEDQKRADERVPHLLATPAVVRFVSVEPQVGHVDLSAFLSHEIGLDWAIIGGESGSRARLFDIAWARQLKEQCTDAGVAFFMKQAGANVIDSDYGLSPLSYHDKKGGNMSEWPEDVRVRQFPGEA